MKQGVIVIVIIVTFHVAVFASGYTPSVTNSVIMELTNCCRLDYGPDYTTSPASEDEISIEEWRLLRLQKYEDLFGMEVDVLSDLSSLTSLERREIFEGFLLNIPDLSTNALFEGNLECCGKIALMHCEKYDYTNSLEAAMRIISAPHSACHNAAIRVFEKFAIPSNEMTMFANSVLSDRSDGHLTAEQGRFLSVYGGMMREHWQEIDHLVRTNGIRLVWRSIDGNHGRVIFDLLMKAIDLNYSASSNRLLFAMDSLMVSYPDTWAGNAMRQNQYDYFAPITNELLSASEPLNVLDLSWLEDAGGAPSMQSNAADEDAGSGLPVDEQSSTSSVLSVIRDFFAAIWEWLCGLFG